MRLDIWGFSMGMGWMLFPHLGVLAGFATKESSVSVLQVRAHLELHGFKLLGAMGGAVVFTTMVQGHPTGVQETATRVMLTISRVRLTMCMFRCILPCQVRFTLYICLILYLTVMANVGSVVAPFALHSIPGTVHWMANDQVQNQLPSRRKRNAYEPHKCECFELPQLCSYNLFPLLATCL